MRATRLVALTVALVVVLALVAAGQQAIERNRRRQSTQALIDTIQSITGVGLTKATPKPTDAQIAARLAVMIQQGALVNGYADTRSSDCKSATPLHVAAGRGMVSSTKVLLDAGAWVDAEDINGDTPLASCVRNRDGIYNVDPLKTATLLLKAGADVNHPLKSGRSILDIIGYDLSHRKLARLLKDAGAKQTPVVLGTQ